MYKCKYFKIQELVPRHVYQERGEQAWALLDDKALMTLDQLREKFGPIVVNNWAAGGNRQWSGLRTPDAGVGAKFSQHNYGRAFDCVFRNVTSQEAIDYVLKNHHAFPHLNALEVGTDGWLHFDTRNCSKLTTFRP